MLKRLKAWRRKRTLGKASLDSLLWAAVTARFGFLRDLNPAEMERLRQWVVLFLADKRINAAGGLELTGEMRLAIAVQACILILNLDPDYYGGWVEVIVYPDEFVPEHEYTGADGVVHVVREPLAGEAWLQGPVVLSWADVAHGGREDGFNVVMHEFAHKLDLLNGGDTNGFPPLHAGMSLEAWSQAFGAAYADFRRRVEQREHTEIDPYAAESPGEFFAVLTEAFFETPAAVQRGYPAVYGQLRAFYRQDPAARMGASSIAPHGRPLNFPGLDTI